MSVFEENNFWSNTLRTLRRKQLQEEQLKKSMNINLLVSPIKRRPMTDKEIADYADDILREP